MSRKIHRGPGLSILVGIGALGALAGFAVWYFSGSEVTGRSVRRFVKLGLIVFGVVAWFIHSAHEKRKSRSRRARPARTPRAARSTPPRRIAANDRQEVTPDLPAAQARPPVPDPPLDLSAWMDFSAALGFEFREDVLVGLMEDHPARIVPRPRGAEVTLTLAAPIGVPLAATVDPDGEIQATSDDVGFSSRFLAGDAPTWMIALGEPTLRIEEDRSTVLIEEVTVDLDLLRGMLLCAAAGARSAEGGGA